MRFFNYFIYQRVTTTLIMLSIFAFGIVCYNILPVSNLPDIEYPTIEVSTSYPGANPDTIADTITSPLERMLTTIDGIQLMSSSSVFGSSTIVIQFTLEKSLESAAQDVQAAINQALPNLPPNLPSFPVYQKTNPTQAPVMYLAVASDTLPQGKIYEYAYSLLGQRLSMVDGVSNIFVSGEPSAVRVQVDPDYLAAHQLGIDHIADAIVNNNPQEPVGSLYGPNHKYIIDIDGQMEHAKEYGELVVRNHHHALLKVNMLGQSIESVQDDKYTLNYIQGEKKSPCVTIGIVKQPRANTVSLIKNVNKVIKEIKPKIPKSVHLHTLFDQSKWINQSIQDVQFALLIAFLLVIVVVLFYLGKVVRTLIPLIALPLAVLGTCILMFFYGFNLDILSLLGITLSIGFLIDDAIVVLENIDRHVEMGKSPLKGTLDGLKEISMTVISMTLSLCCIFLPMILMPGIVGRLFREFSLTIITAVLLSSFVSLVLTPMLCSHFMTPPSSEGQGNWIEKLSYKLHSFLLSLYQKALEWVFAHRALTLSAGLLSLIVTILLLIILPKTFFPEDDLGFINGFGIASDATSPAKMEEYQEALSTIIKEDPNIDSFVAVSGQPTANQSIMFIRLKEMKKRKEVKTIIKNLLEKMDLIPGVKVFLRPIQLINLDVGTEASPGNYQISLQAFNHRILYEHTQEFVTAMKRSPYFRQVTSNLHDRAAYVELTIDRDRAYDLNISAEAIEKAFGNAYSGQRLSLINGHTNQYEVIVETLPSAYCDPSVLGKLYISASDITPLPAASSEYTPPSSFPTQIPISVVADWKVVSGPISIDHINNFAAVTISYDLAPDVPLSKGLNALKQLTQEHLPPQITAISVGSAKVFETSLKNLALLSLLTLVIIYVILGILYKNFTHPLTVMSALPPTALGGLLTLILFRKDLSIYSLIGMIMLLGIVLKNGIMLIDFANKQIDRNASPREAIQNACQKRLRPILMTTFAAMMGAVPIALGIGGMTAASHKPLGMVIIGGLLISQVLTLFFTPTIFLVLENLRHKILYKK